MKKIKLPGVVDTLFTLSGALISAGLGLWLGLAAGLITHATPLPPLNSINIG